MKKKAIVKKEKVWMIWDNMLKRPVAESSKVMELNKILSNLHKISTEKRYELKEKNNS